MGGFRPIPNPTDLPVPEAFGPADVRTATPPQEERLPFGAGYAGTGGQVANIADQFLRGMLQGRQAREMRNLNQANREIDFAGKTAKSYAQGYIDFATRDDVRNVADKFGQWIVANPTAAASGQAPPGATPSEAALLKELGQRKSDAEQAKSRYADVLQQFVAPEKGAKGEKQKGARGVPVIGQLMQMFAPNIQPQMVPSALIDAVRKQPITVPELPTQEKLARAELAEFQQGAPLRAKEREVTGAELDIRSKLAKNSQDLSALYADKSVSPEDRDRREAELFSERRALEGKPITPQERAGEESANVYLSTLGKIRKGLDPQRNPQDFNAAEIAEFRRSFSYRPTSVEQVYLDKIGSQVRDSRTGKERAYTAQDAISEMDRRALTLASEEARIRAKYQLNSFRMQWDYEAEARARQLTNGQRGYQDLTPQERIRVDSDLAAAFKPTPAERKSGTALAKTSDPVEAQKRVSRAIAEAQAQDPDRFSGFVSGSVPEVRATYKPGQKKPSTSGQLLYSFNAKAQPKSGFIGIGGQTQQDFDSAKRDFMEAAAGRMRAYGLTDEQIQQALPGYTPGTSIAPPPVAATSAPAVNPYRQNR